jgi:hypothetical protein
VQDKRDRLASLASSQYELNALYRGHIPPDDGRRCPLLLIGRVPLTGMTGTQNPFDTLCSLSFAPLALVDPCMAPL